MEKGMFPFRMGRVEHIHFIGIGGSGMSGIAEVLVHEGYKITGSDLSNSKVIKHLKGLGIEVFNEHNKNNILNADVVVRSTAVSDDNPEIIAARQHMIPVIPRAMMLAEIMRFRYGIAIAGTHGKTTTTSLVTSLLAEGGLDPSFVIGGKLNSCDTNAQLGKSPYLVAEADESDASFLFLKPMMAVVTNIDEDHMQTYENDFAKLSKTFLEFLHHLPFYGLAVVCIEDEEICRILPLIERPTVTYGFSEKAHYRAINWVQNGLISEFLVQRPSPHKTLSIKFKSPGKHNVLNSLAAIAIATELKISDTEIINALSNFAGVGRRFQMLGERAFSQGKALIIDDYGHHPEEIYSTISAFRAVWPNKRLVHVFQPHRFTRTQFLFKDFVKTLSLADELLLLDIYPAGEEAIPNITSQALAQDIKINFPNVEVIQENELFSKLDKIIQDGDVILMQGAGNIGQLAASLVQTLSEIA